MSEKTTAGADLRLFLQWALLVLGSGLTLMAGWRLGGPVATAGAAFCVLVFFIVWNSARDKVKGPSTGAIVWYVIYAAIMLITLVTN
ncbi:hypothetical protein Lesp02_83660 [Lentzea sp. NBRC 105346]|uniref:hypothetical protein n=1 Tax=Lentzea sp. NBRC 105346 TaxID=3032205 RepID=UPI0024A37EDD|nr:hypothetical protein [Lentzea sp. NBRC 105346]GLZ36179.1 hypothetical protein Lesp02_83660 [Lentzea sp. NBRC 105346]